MISSSTLFDQHTLELLMEHDPVVQEYMTGSLTWTGPAAHPLCPKGLRMHPTYQFQYTRGHRVQRYHCPLLYPQPPGACCDQEQFTKEKLQTMHMVKQFFRTLWEDERTMS
jgi:hypothetical protein